MDLDIKIIENVIFGQASQQEQQAYDTWLAEDPSHKEFVDRVRLYYDSQTDIMVAEEEINSRWNEFVHENAGKFNQNGYGFNRIAFLISAAAILLIAVLLFWPKSDPSQIKNQVAINQTLPEQKNTAPETGAKKEVILTIDGGESYVVDKLTGIAQQEISAAVDSKRISYNHTANVAQKVVYHTINVPKGRDYMVELSDGTRVQLNANSELKYPSTFGNGVSERKVFLKGEAYFDVVKDAKKQFIVEAAGVDVKVYGTKFNVNTNKRGVVETVLVDGSVSMQAECVDECKLKPNQLAIYAIAGKTMDLENVDVGNYTSWTTGTYSFFKVSLDNIALALCQWYDVNIEFADEKAREMLFICNLPRYKSIDQIMEILELSETITYKKSGNTFTIQSK